MFCSRESFSPWYKALNVYCWLGLDGKAGGLFLAGIGGKVLEGIGGAAASLRDDCGESWVNTGGGSLGCKGCG